MSNIIEQLNAEQVRQDIPEFSAGDTVVVKVKIKEGDREREQAFEGVVIAKRNRGLHSAFTVRKISFGEGVERTFALYSSIVASVKVIRSGKVRRAKLYYLRERKGKSAKIAEKIKKKIGIDISEHASNETSVEETAAPKNEAKKEDLKQETIQTKELKKEDLKKEKK